MCSPEEPKSSKGNPNRFAWITIGVSFLFLICTMVTVFYVTDHGQENPEDNIAAIIKPQEAPNPYLVYTLTKAKKICKADTCGSGAMCQQGTGGMPMCACPSGYVGNPVVKCEKLECVANRDCPRNKACHNQHCVNPCLNACPGKNATCDVWSHLPLCSCPKGYVGNPAFEDCKEAEPENDLQTDEPVATEASDNTEGPSEEEQEIDPCNPSPCGPNATCSIIQDQALCYYKTYQDGSSMLRFRNLTEQHQCESDDDCDSLLACREYKCVSPCSDCAVYTTCKKSNHSAICKCRRGFSGDPRIKCNPECEEDNDCPSKTPLCVDYACVDPCHGVCGINAQCRYNGDDGSTTCSCGPYTTGDPLVFCRPTDHRKFCDPNPCGANATCTLSSDTSEEDKKYPLCSCPSGYVGHPRISCELSECEEDSDCAGDLNCFGFQCVDPCLFYGKVCGEGAVCSTNRSLAICTCLEGKYGDPFSGCYGRGGGGSGGGGRGLSPQLVASLIG